MHQLFSQLQLCGGAPDTSTTLIAPPSPRRSSVLTMCFPDEIIDFALSDFCVLALSDDDDAPPAPAVDTIMDDVIVDITSPDI